MMMMTSSSQSRVNLDQKPIDNDDCWQVIRSYFKQHGLVSQQISSFNRFLQKSVQEIVKEHHDNKIAVQCQYHSVEDGKRDDGKFYEVEFGDVIVNSHPHVLERDDRYVPLFPHEARLRNLTYSTEIYVMAWMK